MLITEIELVAFKSYDQASITFAPGMNAILGENGAGKSTILEAVGLALFGHRPSGTRMADLVREGETQARIVVGFSSGPEQQRYQIERRFGKGANTHRLYQAAESDPEERICIAEGHAGVADWIRSELRLDAGTALDDIFELMIGVPQGMLTAAFLETASVRKAVFDPLLRVDEYREAVNGLRPTLQVLRTYARDLEQQIAVADSRLERLPGLVADCAQFEGQIESLKTACQEHTEQQERIEAVVHDLDVLAAAVESAEQTRQAHEQDVRLAEERLSAARQSAQEAVAAKTRADSAQAGYEHWQQAEAERQALEEQRRRRDELRVQHNRAESDLAHLGDRLAELEQTLAGLAQRANEVERLTPEARLQEQLLAQLEAARADSVRAEELGRAQDRTQRELSLAREELARLAAELQETATLTEALATAEGELDRLNAEAQDHSQQLGALQAEMSRLQRQAETLSDASLARCPVCESELTAAHRQRLLDSNQEQQRDHRAKRYALQRAQEERTIHADALRQTLAAKRERLRRLGSPADQDRARERVAQLEGEAQTVAEQLDDLGDPATTVATLRHRLDDLGDPRQRLATCRAQLEQRPRIETERDDANASRTRAQADLEALSEALAPFTDLDARLARVDAIMATHREQHDAYLAAIALAQEVPKRRQQVERLESEHAAADEQLHLSRQALDDARAAYDASEHARQRQALETLRPQLAQDETRLQMTREQLRGTNQEIETLREQQAARAKDALLRVRTDKLIDIVEQVRVLLRDAGPLITRELIGQISREAGTLYAEMMGDYAGELSWAEDYDILLTIRGATRGFRQLSGGEQMVAALAVRLALLRRLTALDIAFFDEPTAHLDPARRENMVEQIRGITGFRQLFVISHDEVFEQVADHCLHIAKTGGVSHVEVV